jgi:hypothetical protein
MPLKWVNPEEFITHQGIVVYHTYKNEDFSNQSEYWYTTSINEVTEFEFDVRELKMPDSIPVHDHAIKIKHNIELKTLQLPDDISYNH